MSEFETRFSGMKQAADQEKRLASEVTEIESEVRNVMNNLQICSSAMAEIKRKLNGNLQNVSTAKQRLQVLSSALEEITALYQNAENRILGKNGSGSGNRGEKSLSDIRNKIDAVSEKYGLDNSSAYSKDPVTEIMYTKKHFCMWKQTWIFPFGFSTICRTLQAEFWEEDGCITGKLF